MPLKTVIKAMSLPGHRKSNLHMIENLKVKLSEKYVIQEPFVHNLIRQNVIRNLKDKK